MSAQGVIALVVIGIGVVLMVAALVVVIRWAIFAARQPSSAGSMTWAQRRHASAQMRSRAPVPAGEVTQVRKVAVQAAAQHRLALIPAAGTVILVGAALGPFPFRFLNVVMAAAALVMAANALAQFDHARRARRFLRAHPDPAGTTEVQRPTR